MDCKIRQGGLATRFPCFFPLVPGWDVAGLVRDAGPAVRGFSRELGAAECIDYREQDVVETVRAAHPDSVDAVFDLVGGEALERSVELLRRGRRVVSVSEPPDPRAFQQQGVSASYVFVLPDADELRVNVEQTLSFGEASRAHELVEAGHVRGKLALIPG